MGEAKAIDGKRCVIYGAGGGGRSFLALNRHRFEPVAFVDADEKVQGTAIEGVEVVAPGTLMRQDFDLVVIASMWVHEIRLKLHELGISDELIVVPPKSQLKNGLPFADLATRMFAQQTILGITEFLAERRVTAFVDFGTLLGIARDGGILEWDDDVDMSAVSSDFGTILGCWPEVRGHLPDPSAGRWSSTWIHDRQRRSLGISLDLTVASSSPMNPFGIYLRCRYTIGPWSIPTGAIGEMEIPSSHFASAEVLPLLDGRVFAPFDHEGYLSTVYGEWRSPRPALSFDDYPSFDDRSFAGIDPTSITESPQAVAKCRRRR